ncbi:hypothetical protein [Rugamonas aquatica]|uniref:Uncharacterized protein n=1 Tax=Rugamonas aquatica TaxID=2743357 RepID=A0A6A7N6M5_9BURK|nr:hypothetical protein [Rugamonas aquatica]MQA40710.1 hypothetical protein [Rugamonas aquatica]
MRVKQGQYRRIPASEQIAPGGIGRGLQLRHFVAWLQDLVARVAHRGCAGGKPRSKTSLKTRLLSALLVVPTAVAHAMVQAHLRRNIAKSNVLETLLALSKKLANKDVAAEQLTMTAIGAMMLIASKQVDGDADVARCNMSRYASLFANMSEEQLKAHYFAKALGGEAYDMATTAISGNVGCRAEKLERDGDMNGLEIFNTAFDLITP